MLTRWFAYFLTLCKNLFSGRPWRRIRAEANPSGNPLYPRTLGEDMSAGHQQSRRRRNASILASVLSALALVVGVMIAPISAQAAANDATLFGTSVPATPSAADDSAVELGITFTPRVNGSVTAIRFYKGTGNTGTHTGSLWSSSGSRLATATFVNETATGWQTVTLSKAVSVTAGTRYVASYYAPRARYAAVQGFFRSSYTSGDLTVPANGGVYRYGTSGFPQSSYQATNYYVDVVFRPTASTPAPSPTTSPTATPTTSPTVTPSATPTTPPSFNPGNTSGTVAVPAGLGVENVSSPDRVVGTGTPASCTSAAVVAAVTAGGVVTFNCGPNPHTITLAETLKVRNSTRKLVLDGGGKVTLSGGNSKRILYIDTCDTSLGSVSGNCLYAPTWPEVTVQNITLANGNATNASFVSPGDPNGRNGGGGAIFALGGRLKVVRSVFQQNVCATNGPDLGGAAIRILAQRSSTPNDLDSSYAARNQEPAAIVQSTFGGTSGKGNSCSNGGAISGLRTPITVLNSNISYNNAVGCCANPAKPGTPGGGSGGAIYTDGDTYDLRIAGSNIQYNTAKAGGSAIFYVSNARTGRLYIDSTVSKNNTYAPSGQSTPQSFQNYPGIFYLGKGEPVFTNSTLQ